MLKAKIVKSKVVVILGPTATGKTKLAVKLAKKFNGEIVSADSRQVYMGMNVGTGKDLREYKIQDTRYKKITNSKSQITNKFKIQNSKFKIRHIPYHLIDIVSPKTAFNVAKFQKLAYRAIDDILARGKLPIVVGGTGLYISAIVDGLVLPESKISNKELERIRKNLKELSLKQLLARLKKIDPKTYKTIDQKNRRRVQRALEIYYQTGRKKSELQEKRPRYDCFQIGIGPVETHCMRLRGNQDACNASLHRRIEKRLIIRLRGGAMIREVKNLHYKKAVSWKRLENFGLEYKWISYYLQNKINYQEMKENLARDIKQFAKRQMTWFKRDKRIVWESE